VRYLLLICHVAESDVAESTMNGVNKYGPTQCYLVSREGQKGLVAYAVDMKVGRGWTKKS
jgi:hypothetical protein